MEERLLSHSEHDCEHEHEQKGVPSRKEWCAILVEGRTEDSAAGVDNNNDTDNGDDGILQRKNIHSSSHVYWERRRRRADRI